MEIACTLGYLIADERGLSYAYQPKTVWGLLDMLRFHGQPFLDCLLYINTVGAIINEPGKIDTPLKTETKTLLLQTLDMLEKQLLQLEFESSAAGARRLRDQVSQHTTIDELLRGNSIEMVNRLRDEIGNKYFLFLTRKESELFEAVAPFGESVSKAFPSATYNVTEASKCLALGRSTAAVFHLMCALEPVLKALSKALHIDSAEVNWATILKKIGDAVDELPDTKNPSDDKTIYSAALAQFYAVKDAWRNHMAHARAKYTEDEAMDIHNAVRSVMKKLAEKISE